MSAPIANFHEAFMRRALELARRAWGATHPNPMVGALIVEDGAIVAEGFHAKAGEPHAEIMALRALGRKPAADATLYVTLEPCCTHGRTPPCTDAIVAAGLKRVVVGATDPNPAHAGHGFEVLRAAGVEVITGVLAEDCADLNLIFNHWIVRQRPLLAAKVATTIDGRIACRTGESKWITGELARADVMRWRRLFPAIAVGAGTVASDDPQLTARSSEGEWCPWRFVFDAALSTTTLNPLPRLFTDDNRGRTIIVTSDRQHSVVVRKLEQLGVRVWLLPVADGAVDSDAFKERCAREGIAGVMVEGGSRLLSALLQRRALDYLLSYRAPRLFADAASIPVATGLRVEMPTVGLQLAEVRHAVFGDDQLMRGRIVYPENLEIEPAPGGESDETGHGHHHCGCDHD
ncbi:MAG TPA: bifunctional diaminohydroxyphosphoribosylaminopyrimidine deaminase/5-amino-6-(5-phosphoribosylamino)uracil reductase RibD [Opitutaceae bacterium]|nr:bifunctional diaminohydroxyphosphoribosylaminopyrimidine deaminase/5-amino-6-(5-phosphoribosylamino)uracil reductase RibD [Opitutaceae bacterium]